MKRVIAGDVGCAFFVASHYYTYPSVWFTALKTNWPQWDCYRGIGLSRCYGRRYREFCDRSVGRKDRPSEPDRCCGTFRRTARRATGAWPCSSDTPTGLSKVKTEQIASSAVPASSSHVFDHSASSSFARDATITGSRRCGQRGNDAVLLYAEVLCRSTKHQARATVLQHRGR